MVGQDTATPLITITFEDVETSRTAVRYWYHVPRIGDGVVLEATNVDSVIAGRVSSVIWDTNGEVWIKVK